MSNPGACNNAQLGGSLLVLIVTPRHVCCRMICLLISTVTLKLRFFQKKQKKNIIMSELIFRDANFRHVLASGIATLIRN